MHPRTRDACRVRTPGRGHGSPGVSPSSIHLVFEEGTSIARVMLDTFVRSWQWCSVLLWCRGVFRSKFRFCVGRGNFSGRSQDLNSAWKLAGVCPNNSLCMVVLRAHGDCRDMTGSFLRNYVFAAVTFIFKLGETCPTAPAAGGAPHTWVFRFPLCGDGRGQP